MSISAFAEAMRIMDRAREVGSNAVRKLREATDDEKWSSAETILERLVTVSYAQNEALQIAVEQNDRLRKRVDQLEAVDA